MFQQGESQLHEWHKHQLANYFENIGYHVEIEAWIEMIKQRPDLLISNAKQAFAIEFQHSKISTALIKKRTVGYQKIGLTVIWIASEQLLAKQTVAVNWAKFGQCWGDDLVLFNWQQGKIWLKKWVWVNQLSQDKYLRNFQAICKQSFYADERLQSIVNRLYYQGRIIKNLPKEYHSPYLATKYLKMPSWLLNLDILLLLERKQSTIVELLNQLMPQYWLKTGAAELEFVQYVYLRHVLKVWLKRKIVRDQNGKFYLARPLVW
ncbi:competence protein CoiA [Weissella oryzae SG25]|uniref:Competence protein CoiA n=1 Tax=Weissella oryzae (strain DSM 25784 / JCM 18191 / LMG 30913 / SG25) TaxID=1329250 RepID=A0A069CS75_WEIOS|nr:competence protein CoiA family protein [Weissella oryzae]GAK30247.1 competence protein CoiA [Weissella oryzae SG25]